MNFQVTPRVNIALENSDVAKTEVGEDTSENNISQQKTKPIPQKSNQAPNKEKREHILDKISKVVAPLSCILVNIIYFLYYTQY